MTDTHNKPAGRTEKAMRDGVWFPVVGLWAWLFCLSLGPVQGGKVLVIPTDGSHWLSMKILVKELVRKGHEVLVLAPDSSLLMHASEGYKTETFKAPFSKEEMDANYAALTTGLFLHPPGITDLPVNIQRFVNFTSLHMRSCDSIMNNQHLMSRLKGMDFDVMLTDPFIPCGSIVADIISIPTVYFLRGLPCELDLQVNQCPTPPSYVPVAYSGNTNVMNFLQRVKNLLMSGVQKYICTMTYRHYDVQVRTYLGDHVSYTDLLSRGSIWLLRYDFTFEWPRPTMPNMVFIGGINCGKKEPLPADLEEFVEGSGDDGFIVLTLGSMIPKMPEDKAQHFIDAFRQIPQRVVWRYAGAAPRGLPKNVKLMKWLPQKDLLAHPKAKLFITHGGSHSVYEGICYGVPMLMFPLFGDQPDNVNRMVAHGVAGKLEIYDVTSEKLLASMNQILHNRSYKENMERLSRFHLDRPVPPLDLAVYWTEFVMRHKGAPHLRVSAHDLNWIQYHSLDSYAFLLFILLTVVWLMCKCCSCCCRRGRTKKKRE